MSDLILLVFSMLSGILTVSAVFYWILKQLFRTREEAEIRDKLQDDRHHDILVQLATLKMNNENVMELLEKLENILIKPRRF